MPAPRQRRGRARRPSCTSCPVPEQSSAGRWAPPRLGPQGPQPRALRWRRQPQFLRGRAQCPAPPDCSAQHPSTRKP
eukprot:542757-Alexandrium_andersonii.AAC.1